MKKLLYIFLFLFSIIYVNAQFDTEHWIAPFADKTGGNGADQYLYLSTNKTTPFKVSIYNNNTLYNTVQISKGSPAKVYISRDLMITSDNTQKFIKSKMGLHLVGEKKFFAHFRFSVPSHAEIITSKGKAGLGNEFYAFTPANNAARGNANSTVGLIASEDNTIITLDHFNDVTLSNNEAVSTTTVKSITLNKGESYILDKYDGLFSVKTNQEIKSQDSIYFTKDMKKIKWTYFTVGDNEDQSKNLRKKANQIIDSLQKNQ